MGEDSLTTYPEPQRWYSINAAALTWPELYRASGNPVTFVLSAPVLGFCKLFGIKLPSGTLPREITFQTPQTPVPEPHAGRVQRLLEELQGLGFAHFTTFAVPEFSHQPVMYACLHGDGLAYADVTYVASRGMVYGEFVSRFADGYSLTTVSQKLAVAINTYPNKEFILCAGRPVGEQWERHRSRAEVLAKEHGGYGQDMAEEELFTHMRADVRRYCDFQAGRGLLVALPDYRPAGVPGQTGHS